MFEMQNLLPLFIFMFFAVLLIKSALLFLNISHLKKHRTSVPKKFINTISAQEHYKAQDYTISKNKFSLFSIFCHSAITLFWIFGGGINLINDLTLSLSQNLIMQGVIFFVFFGLVNTVIDIFFNLYNTFVIEQKYGFNNTTKIIFVKDLVKQLLLSSLIGGIFLYLLLFILYSLGENWWAFAWAFMSLFQFILIWAYPKFISPLFNKFHKLEDEGLSDKIKDLCLKCGINFKDYFVMDASMRSSHGNAYFTGFGKNKRIVFFDTLLKSLTPDEVIAVLAHELGHFKKKHIYKSIFISLCASFIGFALLGYFYNHSEFLILFGQSHINAHTSILVLLLIAPYFTYFLTPIMTKISRNHEFEADEFAAVNSDARLLISALVKMYKDNSSSLTPHPLYSAFYYSHPPANERVEFLESFS